MLQKLGEMLDGLEIRHLKDVPMFGLSAALCTRIMEICKLNSIYSFSTKKSQLGTFRVDKRCHTGGNIYNQLWMLPKSIWGSQKCLLSDIVK